MGAEQQTTLAGALEFAGTGLHKGCPVSLRIEPAPADAGVSFELNGTLIPATVLNASVTARNTELTDGGATTIHTVEHVLSALYGMGVDNARVILDAQEPPAHDGSAERFAKAINDAGIVSLEAPRDVLELAAPLLFQDRGASVLFLPADGFRATYILDHPHRMVGRQAADFRGGRREYIEDVAAARTFGLIEEVDALRAAGLALGGSTENAIVVYPDSYSSPLRFDNEFARHKLLDLIGDISLIGRPMNAHCIGIKSGHAVNIKSVKRLFEELGLE
ncbi:MAG: UDP-3-O-acyl-N-acetylglucosamine deacetylase [bacterium]